jgi:hypothetical protein
MRFQICPLDEHVKVVVKATRAVALLLCEVAQEQEIKCVQAKIKIAAVVAVFVNSKSFDQLRIKMRRLNKSLANIPTVCILSHVEASSSSS